MLVPVSCISPQEVVYWSQFHASFRCVGLPFLRNFLQDLKGKELKEFLVYFLSLALAFELSDLQSG